MEKEQIIYEVCAVIDEMERQKKISMACRLRDLNLPQSEEEQEDLANVLSERVKARHDSFAFNTWYQFLSTYEDALYVAQEIEKRSQSASLCIQKDFTAYYSFAELLLRMDKHTVLKQLAAIDSLQNEENIHAFYRLKNRKELLEVAIQESRCLKEKKSIYPFEQMKEDILNKNKQEKRKALQYFGFAPKVKQFYAKPVHSNNNL